MSDESTPETHGIDAGDLAGILEGAHFRHQHAEPIVRDLNRAVTDLIGAFPGSPDGKWFALQDDGSVTLRMDIVDALRVSTALAEISRGLTADDVRRALPSRHSLARYLKTIVDESMTPANGTSVHIGGRRFDRFFRKGE